MASLLSRSIGANMRKTLELFLNFTRGGLLRAPTTTGKDIFEGIQATKISKL